jgi:hypothetical protein
VAVGVGFSRIVFLLDVGQPYAGLAFRLNRVRLRRPRQLRHLVDNNAVLAIGAAL